ncbi:hypothetical protein PALB_9660 [Pseudoalteromonas luteoviolacea B = ATCC 29581]|nr:hypothetical protein PALB_9660 [Pseudoalteromonas luteoviolacea B = ATCC 29581]
MSNTVKSVILLLFGAVIELRAHFSGASTLSTASIIISVRPSLRAEVGKGRSSDKPSLYANDKRTEKAFSFSPSMAL